jgi:uncharacterized membrane protein
MTAFRVYDPRGARQRLILAVVIGVVAYALVPAEYSTATRIVVAWDACAAVLLAVTMSIILRSDSSETRRRAAAEDPGRLIVWVLVLAACTFSLFAAVLVIRHTKGLPRFEGHALLVLCIASVVISWLLTHCAFTLRYAHLYYRGGRDGEGGLVFQGKQEPDDLDFAYFAFTIGMCFQVSDVTIENRLVRRTSLVHALLSFAYNTGILALAINVVFNQLG